MGYEGEPPHFTRLETVVARKSLQPAYKMANGVKVRVWSKVIGQPLEFLS